MECRLWIKSKYYTQSPELDNYTVVMKENTFVPRKVTLMY